MGQVNVSDHIDINKNEKELDEMAMVKRRERWNNPPTLEQIRALNKDKGKTAEKSKTKKNGKTK